MERMSIVDQPESSSSLLAERRGFVIGGIAAVLGNMLSGCSHVNLIDGVSSSQKKGEAPIPEHFALLPSNHIIRKQWPYAKKWMEEISLIPNARDVRYERYFPEEGPVRLWVSVTVRYQRNNEIIIHTIISHTMQTSLEKYSKNGGMIEMNIIDSDGKITQSEPSVSGASTTFIDCTATSAPYKIAFDKNSDSER
jgi:hypothetical protein